MKKIINFAELQSDVDRLEHLVSRILERKGFRMVRKRSIGPDKGRDLIFQENLDSLIKPKTRNWVVQCKLSESNIGYGEVDNIEKTVKMYEADAYLLVVSSDVTESLMDYVHSFANDFDTERCTYHELQEEILANLDLFCEYFPQSYQEYIERWQGEQIDLLASIKMTKHSYTQPGEWDSLGRWYTYHGGWYQGNLQLKKMQKKSTLIIENPNESGANQFAVALYGERVNNQVRQLNICKPSSIKFSCLYEGEFVLNLDITGEDMRPYYIAYSFGTPISDPHDSFDGYARYANYNLSNKKKIGQYLGIERIVHEDLIRLFSVAPIIVNRICFTTTKTAKIRDLLIFS